MSGILNQTIAHHSLHPKNLSIIHHKKSWLLSLDVVVLSDFGNIYDAMFMAARAALWDTKVPRTRSVEYKAKKGDPVWKGKGGGGNMDVDGDTRSGFDTRNYVNKAADFELMDYWDDGEILDGRSKWPVCVTLNLVCIRMTLGTFSPFSLILQVPPIHYLDATIQEEASTSLRLLLMFSFASPSSPDIQGMRLLGGGELDLGLMKDLVKVSFSLPVHCCSAIPPFPVPDSVVGCHVMK